MLQNHTTPGWSPPSPTQVLPYFLFYKGALGRVAEFSCTVSKFQRMRVGVSTAEISCAQGMLRDAHDTGLLQKERWKGRWIASVRRPAIC